jgi:effector-binding domain-containing protein
MKIFKKILIGTFIFILLILVISFFLPSEINIKRSIKIQSPGEIVFKHVNNLKSWEKWAIWFMIDSAMEKSYSSPEEGKGAKVQWNSKNNKVGNGNITITESAMPDSILMDLNFMENGIAKTGFYFYSDSAGTKITWVFKSDLGNNPLMKYFGLIMGKFVSSDFDDGLALLKKYCESLPKEPQYKIEIEKIESLEYFSERDTCSVITIGAKLGKMYTEIFDFISKNGIKESNPPFAIYHKFDGNIFDMEAGIPVDKLIPSKNKIIKSGKFSPSQAVVAYYYGPYEKDYLAHQQLKKWIKKHNKKIINSPFEVYVSDPSMEKDSSKWLTKIYYPFE